MKKLNRATVTTNQVPVKVLQFGEGNFLRAFVEWVIDVLNKKHLKPLIETLEDRMNDITNEHHIKRLNKNLKKLYKLL